MKYSKKKKKFQTMLRRLNGYQRLMLIVIHPFGFCFGNFAVQCVKTMLITPSLYE